MLNLSESNKTNDNSRTPQFKIIVFFGIVSGIHGWVAPNTDHFKESLLPRISPSIHIVISSGQCQIDLLKLPTGICSYFLVNRIWCALCNGLTFCIGIQVSGKAVVMGKKESEAILSEILGLAGRWTLTFGKCKHTFSLPTIQKLGSTTKANYYQRELVEILRPVWFLWRLAK